MLSEFVNISSHDFHRPADIVAMELTCTAPAPYTIPAPTATTSRTSAAAERTIQVLMVEDDPEAAELAKAYLTADGNDAFYVEWSSNLFKAMYRLKQPGIDVVLLDLGMPELSGYKSHRAIESAAGRPVPVVILTADDRSLTKELTLGYGASDYLLKQHISPSQLRQSLRKAVLGSRI
jgi:two-component system, OmpR family, catabolic regulation response regulator CreB